MSFWSTASNSASRIVTTTAVVVETSARFIETAASGLDMLDSFVDLAKQNQVAKHTIAKADFLENLIQEATLEQSRREQTIAKQLSGDTDLQSRYSKIEIRNRALFAPAPAINP